MFWQTKPMEETSLDILLKSDIINLVDILDDPYTLQEIRNCNDDLLTYLTREDVLLEMMNTALRPEIDASLPLRLQYKHAHLCSEILSLTSNQLSEAIVSSEPVLAVLSEFMGDHCAVNHLVASFYMKIICELLSRFPEKILEVLDSGRFVERCLENLHLSAVSELVYRLISIPYGNEISLKIRQWYVDNGFVEGSISLLDPSFPSAAHDNVGYLWSELIKVLRDVLYSSEDKHDPLLEKMQSKEIIDQLMNKMLKLGSCGGVCESVVGNVCQILVTLIGSNFVPNCPSHQLSDGNRGDFWMGGIPDNPNMLDGQEVWQPDNERVVETVVAQHATELLHLIIEELEDEERGDCDSWLSMLQLLVSLCDTMYMPTHVALYEAFKKENLGRLFDLANSNPTMCLLHKLLHKMITYILFTATPDESPLVSYVLTELDIVAILLRGVHPQCTLPLLPLICLRAFYCNLADFLNISRNSGPNKERIEDHLKGSARWEEVTTYLEDYNEWNKSDAPDPHAAAKFSMQKDEDFFGSGPNSLQLAHQALYDFEASCTGQLLPDVFDATAANKLSECEANTFNVSTSFDFHLSAKLDNLGVDESDFEKLCTLRATHEMDQKNGENEEDWPGADSSTDASSKDFWTNSVNESPSKSPFDDWAVPSQTSSFPVDWNSTKQGTNQAEAETGEGDDWPAESENNKPSNDFWADFSSTPIGKDTSIGSDNKMKDDEWTINEDTNMHPDLPDPVLAGLSSTVLPTSFDNSSSEC